MLYDSIIIGTVGGVVAIAGEPIQLPNKHGIEQLAIAVFDHPLEFGTVVRLCGERAVDICTEHDNAVALGKFHAFSNLTFDALLSLIVTRIPSVNYCFHQLSLFLLTLSAHNIFSDFTAMILSFI